MKKSLLILLNKDKSESKSSRTPCVIPTFTDWTDAIRKVSSHAFSATKPQESSKVLVKESPESKLAISSSPATLLNATRRNAFSVNTKNPTFAPKLETPKETASCQMELQDSERKKERQSSTSWDAQHSLSTQSSLKFQLLKSTRTLT